MLRSLKSAVAAAGVVAGLIVSLLGLVLQPARMLLQGGREGSTSRGDAIFEQGQSVRDQMGFMDQVKNELQSLFAFMKKCESTLERRLVIVCFVDDLDRCLESGFRPGMGNVLPDRLFWAQTDEDEGEEEAPESSFEISPHDTRH